MHLIPPNYQLHTPQPRPFPRHTILFPFDVPKRSPFQRRLAFVHVGCKGGLVSPVADDLASPGLGGWERVGSSGPDERHEEVFGLSGGFSADWWDVGFAG